GLVHLLERVVRAVVGNLTMVRVWLAAFPDVDLRVDDQHALLPAFRSAGGRGGCPGRRCLRLRRGRGGGGERHDEAPPRHEAASQHGGFRGHDFLPVCSWIVAAAAPPSSVMNSRRFTSNFSRASKRKIALRETYRIAGFQAA